MSLGTKRLRHFTILHLYDVKNIENNTQTKLNNGKQIARNSGEAMTLIQPTKCQLFEVIYNIYISYTKSSPLT